MLETAIVGVLAFAAQFVLFRGVVADYYPHYDEFALLCNSTPYARPLDPTRWITSGFSKYFITYPEINVPSTAFVRPMANLTYWVNYCLFGDSWGNYLYAGYLFAAVACGLVFWLARGFLETPRWLSAAAAAIMFLAPSASHLRFNPAYAFDMLAARLGGNCFAIGLEGAMPGGRNSACRGVIHERVRRDYARGGGRSRSSLIRRRSGRWPTVSDGLRTIALLVPLGVWIAVRLAFFRGLSEVYSVRELLRPWALAVSAANGLLHWPLGFLPEGADVVASFRSLLFHGDLRSAPVVLAVLANLAVLVLLVRLLHNLRKRADREKYCRESLLWPWLLGSLAVVVALSLSTRMGCSVYLFVIPLLASVSWKAGGSRRAGRCRRDPAVDGGGRRRVSGPRSRTRGPTASEMFPRGPSIGRRLASRQRPIRPDLSPQRRNFHLRREVAAGVRPSPRRLSDRQRTECLAGRSKRADDRREAARPHVPHFRKTGRPPEILAAEHLPSQPFRRRIRSFGEAIASSMNFPNSRRR